MKPTVKSIPAASASAANVFPPVSGTRKRPRTPAQWQALAHDLIPGGAHTYAKGDDQYPSNAPPVLERGLGCRVWDGPGREFIEYGSGLRSVTLGHAFPSVVEAAYRQMLLGANFTRPTHIEIETAAAFLNLLPGADMVKFAKNASDCTTAAVKLARACTGRDKVAFCGDQPFYSTDDWFIGTTAMSAGIPAAIRDLSVTFRYNDAADLARVLETHSGQIACVMLEPATVTLPNEGYLQDVQALCRQHGALLVFDETITGFRWHIGGAQAYYDVTPDLSVFGKALGNGFAVSALAGRREFMERGGLRHEADRVFLLSTTHGAETHSLAAAAEVMRTYAEEPVIETLWARGAQLKAGCDAAIAQHGLEAFVQILGPPCNLVFATRDAAGERSQAFRTLFMQELVARGVLAPSFVVNYAHTPEDIDLTIAAVNDLLPIYRRALEHGVEPLLQGPAVKPVFRRLN